LLTYTPKGAGSKHKHGYLQPISQPHWYQPASFILTTIQEALNQQIHNMKANHLIYLVSPFGIGALMQKILNIPDTSYWFYVSLLCIASVFFFVKFILPAIEQKFDAISPLDMKGAYEDKMSQQKPFSYVVGIHMATFVIILIVYFTS
jgi:hypothetical protein